MTKNLAGISTIVAIVIAGVLLLATQQDSQSAVITIKGMKCQDCADRISDKLSGMEGVQQAEVLLSENLAKVSYNPTAVTLAQLENAIKDLGFNQPQAASDCPYLEKTSNCCEKPVDPS